MGRTWLGALVPTSVPEACGKGFLLFSGLSVKPGQVEESHGGHWTCSFPSFRAPPSDGKQMECDRVVGESYNPAPFQRAMTHKSRVALRQLTLELQATGVINEGLKSSKDWNLGSTTVH